MSQPHSPTVDRAAAAPRRSLLHLALQADAVLSGAAGILMLAGAGQLSGMLGLPAALLAGAGAVLLPFAAAVAWLGLRENPPPAAVWAVIAVNALWVVESVMILLLGWVQPTGLGIAFVLAQAAAVAVFAELQYVGLRRRRT